MDKAKTSDNVQYIIRNNNQVISVYSIPELNFPLNIENFPSFETVFVREINRLRTFRNYPIDGISPSLLARDGFMYWGNGYEVVCIFCRRQYSQWSTGDDVHEIHSHLSQQCPMITGTDLLNVSLHNYGTDSEIINNVQYRNEDIDQTQQPTEEDLTREIVIPETDVDDVSASATNVSQLQGTYDSGLSTFAASNVFQSEIIDERKIAVVTNENVMSALVQNPKLVTIETRSRETTLSETDVNNLLTSVPNFINRNRTHDFSLENIPTSTLLQYEEQELNDAKGDDENILSALSQTYQLVTGETLAPKTSITASDVSDLVTSTTNFSNFQGSCDDSLSTIPPSIVTQASRDSVVELSLRREAKICNTDVLTDDTEFQRVETQTLETILELPAELSNNNVFCQKHSVISIEIPVERSGIKYSVDGSHKISVEYSQTEEKTSMQINISCTKKCSSCNNQNSTNNVEKETGKKKTEKLLSQDLDDKQSSNQLNTNMSTISGKEKLLQEPKVYNEQIKKTPGNNNVLEGKQVIKKKIKIGVNLEDYEQFGVISDIPKKQEFKDPHQRLNAFKGWPSNHHLEPNILSEAGFYHTGQGDCT
ncbi:hypothetical protein Btru_042166 [Bulinus truncatus]|nr:hypothetical protein Btru_042166 [Bulinus truncatus]